MNICPNCGLATSGGANFCSGCGAVVHSEPSQTEAPGMFDVSGAVESVKTFDSIEAVKTFDASQAVRTEVVSGAMPLATPQAEASWDAGQKVENYLIMAILATVCCCIPFGIVAIIYASKVNPLVIAKDYAAALEASKKAKFWGFLAIGAGAVSNLLVGILYAVYFAALMER